MNRRTLLALAAGLLLATDALVPLAGVSAVAAKDRSDRNERREERQDNRREREAARKSREQRPDRDEKREGCALLGEKPPRPRRGDPAAKIEFFGEGRDRRRQERQRFNAAEVVTVVISVDWKNLDPGASQRLEVYSPDGDLFRAFVAPASNDRPVDTPFPLRGWITQHSLYGTWCAEVFVVGDPEPVARRAFTVRFRQ
ncbi:MAG: hypothetical protein FJ027_10860 [Candidatus Rokubacteria bacterium]|nr:hypothetical protein [Candidatus Rokubacteria bacterium]